MSRHGHPVPTVPCRACDGEGLDGEYVHELCGEGEDRECTACDGTGNVELPWKYEVCERCEGRGHVCNLGAMTGSEYREMLDGDPDFPEDYKRGMYDVPCPECRGLRVVAEPDSVRMLPWQHDAWDKQCEDARDERDAERYGY
jgi:RecJ-like exonuclease